MTADFAWYYNTMIRDLFDFAKQRSLKEAIIFYVAFGVASFIIAFIIAFAVAVLAPTMTEASLLAQRVGMIIWLTISLGLGVAILAAKQAFRLRTGILLVVIAILTTFNYGIVFALVVVAYLTTLKPRGAAAPEHLVAEETPQPSGAI